MNKKPYEVIVIGSGATGGVAAKTFAENGVRVLVIEAGPELTPQEAMGSEPINSFNRLKGIITGQHKIQSQHPGYWKSNPLLYANEIENPYEYPQGKPFLWTQGQQVGGRSLTWGGITLRLSDGEFKGNEIDHFGPSWPIRHKDLSIHYTSLEKAFKIHGHKDNLEQLPDGEYIKELPFTNSEINFAESVKKSLGYPVIHSRGFGPKSSTESNKWPLSSSPGSSLKSAIGTGNIEIISDHIVERFTLDRERKSSNGIIIVNKRNGARHKLDANLIVICASTIQTNKILLNSEEKTQDNGFIDPSNLLGHYLMDHISICRFFSLSNKIKKENNSVSTEKNILSGAGSLFIPLGSKYKSRSEIDFIRGYGIWGGINRFGIPECINTLSNSHIGFLIGHGEVLANPKNRVSLSSKTDRLGLKIPFIDFEWGDNEIKMAQHMVKTIEELISISGGQILPISKIINKPIVSNFIGNPVALKEEAPPPGYYIHEVGGARMGLDEKNSVVDKWNRLWRCQNVLVVDGACWPTSGWQSPTLTMMAITRRACLNAIKSLSD